MHRSDVEMPRELESAPQLDELAALARVRGRLLGVAPAPLTIGRYRVMGRLGKGGMGLVYAARDHELDRAVAIKVLRRELAGEQSRQRFVREAQALARLSHPNVVQVYEVGRHRGEVFIAMELVGGTTLRSWCAQAPRSWREIVRVYVAAGRGLAAAHRAGLVHRDFKPDNVIVDEDERPRVLDFGVAQFHSDGPSLVPVTVVGCDPGSMTLPGAVVGTVAYMAPEQRHGERADARADQFAFAVALYEALYGMRPPTEATTELGVVEDLESRTRRQVRTAKRSPAVPAWLHGVLLRAMATEPDARWPSMDALLAQLCSPPRRRLWFALAVAGVAAIVGGGAVLVERTRAAARCDEDAQVFATWWSDARAQAGAGLLATGSPFAAGTWTRAVPRLDRFVDEWTAVHARTCRATAVDGELAAPMLAAARECLAERRAWIESLVAIWTQAGPADVPAVGTVAAGLPELDTCEDPRALQRRIDEGPDAGAVRARMQLFRGEAALRAGHLEDALAIAATLEDAAADATRAGAHLLGARVRMDRTDLDGARTAADAALVAATAAGHSDLVGDASLVLALLASAQLRFADAEQWSAMARAAYERAGVRDDEPRRARMLHGLGSIAMQRGDLRTAAALHREALEIFEANFGAEHVETINALEHVAIDSTYTGAGADAVAGYERLLALREQVLGPDHASVASTSTNFGLLLARQGRFAEAIEMHERAMAIDVAHFGPDHPYVANNLGNLASAWCERGEHERALGLLRRALEIERRAGDDTIYVARVQGSMASILASIGRVQDAVPLAESALAIEQRALGVDHPETSSAHRDVGFVLAKAGRFAESREHLERAIALRESAMLPDDTGIAEVRGELGRSLLAAGDAAGALQQFDRAAAQLEIDGASPWLAARNRFGRAQALARTGRTATALALAERSAAVLIELGAVTDADEVARWLTAQRQASEPAAGRRTPPL